MRAILLAVAIWACPAATVGTSVPAQSLTTERIAALPPGSLAAWQDYLARSTHQGTADRAVLESEWHASPPARDRVPPSGVAARSLPLNRPPEWYAGPEARQLADIVLSFQTPAGGWSKNLDFAGHQRRAGERFAPSNASTHLDPGDFDTPHDPRWNYVGTLDNDATTTELRFLAKVAAAAPETSGPYRAAFLAGIQYLFAAQLPNGGWPQVWPLEGGYHDAITFNDGAVIQAMELLRDAAAGNPAFVPADIRRRASASVDRGVECILATQIVVKGHPTVWAQQYDPLSLLPVAGRNYEPAAQSALESAGVLLFLMSLPAPSPAVVEAVHAGAAWLHASAIQDAAYTRGPESRTLVPSPGAPPVWARFYDIASGRPVFADRDKTIHDTLADLSPERQNSYRWYGTGPQEALDLFAAWSAAHPLPAPATTMAR